MSVDVDLTNLCRLCLVKDGGNIPIFADDDSERIVKITICLPVTISRTDCFPKSICNSCSVRLESSFRFWNVALNAEKELVMLSKQVDVKSEVDAEEAVLAVMQIKNELLETNLELVNTCKQEAAEVYDVSTEICKDEILHEVKAIKSDPEFTESSEFSSLGHSMLENPSTSFETDKQNKRVGVVKAAKFIHSVARDNEEENFDDSNTDEEFTRPTSGSEDLAEDFDPNFISVGTMKNTKVADADVKIEIREPDEIVKCGLKITRHRSERKHFVRKSSNCKLTQSSGRRKCTVCEKNFSNSCDLVRHMCIHTGDKPYECNVCEYKCITSTMLKRHMCKHTGKKPYECNVCQYKFSHHDRLKVHMRKHTGEKPYECNICEYKCSESCNLKKHVRKHTGEKPYKCDVCEYKCSRLHRLKTHMCKHTGEKPYECTVCVYKTSERGNLKKHMRKHSDEKPYKCDVCEYKSSRPHNLKTHMRKHAD